MVTSASVYRPPCLELLQHCYMIGNILRHNDVACEQVVDIAIRVNVIGPRLTQFTVFDCPLQL